MFLKIEVNCRSGIHNIPASNYPLISCICITKNRLELLKRAIICFEHQTYPNKELIIVYEDDITATYLENNVVNPNIFAIKIIPSKENKLGNLRNLAIWEARGQYICQWDDDDWYHTERLSYQYHVIKETGYKGSILTRWLMFDNTTDLAYISCRRLWEGSVLCDRETIMQKAYVNRSKGEEEPVIKYLTSGNFIKAIPDMPHLYIYNFHGSNTFNYGHFSNLITRSIVLPFIAIDKIKNILQLIYPASEGAQWLNNIFNGLYSNEHS